MTTVCWVGGVGSVIGSGWTKTGGEILRRVNGKLGSLLADWNTVSHNSDVLYRIQLTAPSARSSNASSILECVTERTSGCKRGACGR